MQSNRSVRQLYSPELVQAAWTSLVNETAPNEQLLDTQNQALAFMKVYKALQQICKLAPNKRKLNMIDDILTDNKIPASVWAQVKHVVDLQSPIMDDCLKCCRPRAHRITDVSWKINVVVCSSSMSKVLQPVVELSLTIDSKQDGRRNVVLQLDVPTFHKLRQTLAVLLKHMIRIQARPSLQ